ncbi:MAG: Gfo/Idh/MocA family protein [Armatimonadota bacterium]
MQPIRVLVIGAGSWRGAWFTGEFHHHPNFEVAALVDVQPKVPAAVCKFLELGNIPIYSDAIEALDQVECDAVLVIVPDFLHKQFAVEALKRGKYVYVEKPMSVSLPDCLEIVRADRAAGGKTMVGHNRRYVPSYRKVYQLVQQGLVGQPLTIQADEYYYNGRTFFRRWNRLRRMGGGLWVTKGCHDFDYQYWLTGSLPKTVSATASLSVYQPKPGAAALCRDCAIEKDCPDSHLKFRGNGDYYDFPPLRRVIEEAREDSGAPADLCLYNSEKDTFDNGTALVTFRNEVKASFTMSVVAPFTDNRIRVNGTEGTLDASYHSPDVLYWKRHDGEDFDRAQKIPVFEDGVMIQGSHGGADNVLLNEFLAFIRGENPHAPRPAEASIAIAIADAATRAGDEERTIHLEEMDGWAELKSYL